jgi:hypothetical protein
MSRDDHAATANRGTLARSVEQLVQGRFDPLSRCKRGQSDDMMEKELLVAVMAYNCVRSCFMLHGAPT